MSLAQNFGVTHTKVLVLATQVDESFFKIHTREPNTPPLLNTERSIPMNNPVRPTFAIYLIPFIFSFFLIAPTTIMAQGTLNPDNLKYTARTEDVSSIDAIMKAYYEVVSGPANTPRDVARDLSLHHPKAQVFPLMHDKNGKPELLVFSIKEFHEWGKPVYDAGFFESEIKRTVTSFGQTFHVWSTYETRTTPNGPVVSRGINNIQLYFDGQRFWILSETWDSERPNNPIPTYLTPNTKP